MGIRVPLLLLGALTGCGRRLDAGECLSLVNRYAELLVREEQPRALPEDMAEARARVSERALHEKSFGLERCPAAVSRRQYDCAMEASSVDAVERCLVF